MLHGCIKRVLTPLVLLSCLVTGCSYVDQVNTGRGAWNAPEYTYQPPWITKKFEDAIAKMEDGDRAEAIAAFEQFIADHPEYPGAYVNLAILYAEENRNSEAMAQLEMALVLDDDYVYALNQKGLLQRKQGDFEGARESWLACTRSTPDYANAWYNLGVLYDLYLQDLPAALEAYTRYQQIVLSSSEDAEEDAKVAKWIKDLERRLGQALQASQREESL